ncbi:MAG: hypothetical protein ACYC6Y_31740, partial [Thermoguttaceae bacterium]
MTCLPTALQFVALPAQATLLAGPDANIPFRSTTYFTMPQTELLPDLFASSLPSALMASARSHANPGMMVVWFLAVAGVLAAAIAGAAFATRLRQRRRMNSHSGLFAGLCQHHNLDRGDRNLLKAIAQAHQVRYAARVFLDPTLFEPKRLPSALRARQDEILALRRQLFLATDDPSPPLQ